MKELNLEELLEQAQPGLVDALKNALTCSALAVVSPKAGAKINPKLAGGFDLSIRALPSGQVGTVDIAVKFDCHAPDLDWKRSQSPWRKFSTVVEFFAHLKTGYLSTLTIHQDDFEIPRDLKVANINQKKA